MRKIICLLLTFCLWCCCVLVRAASVTDARWGVNANNVLRLVIDVSNPITYNLKIEDNSLRVLMDADLAKKSEGSWSIGSSYAKKMTLKEQKGRAELDVALSQKLGSDDYKTFVLRPSAQNKAYRIIVDIGKKIDSVTANKPVVSNHPVKKPANSGASWTPASTSTGGSWTDRFKKSRTEQPTKPVLSAQERVRLSIQQAKQAAKEQHDATVAAQIAPAQQQATAVQQQKQHMPVVQPVDKSKDQNTLKKYLSAKQAARREAAAEAASKKKNKKVMTSNAKKDKADTGWVLADGVYRKVEDGLTYYRGLGKFRTSGGLKDKLIAIDPGHGGTDPGAIGAAGTMEKNLTLPIAQKIRVLLEKAGARVYVTRSTDVDVYGRDASDRAELQARVNVAEKNNVDLFISVHINASINKDISGISSYYYPKTANDARISSCIQKKLTGSFSMNDLGVREANFYVIKRSSMPATLLELGFISNKKEENLMRSNWYQEKAAAAIFAGIRDYFGA